MADQGWYQDPTSPGQLRYWNGEAWTEHTHPGASPWTQPGTTWQPGVQHQSAGGYVQPYGAPNPDQERGRKRRTALYVTLSIVVGLLVVGGIGAAIVAAALDENNDAAASDSPGADDSPTPGGSPDSGFGERPSEVDPAFVLPDDFVEWTGPDQQVTFGVPGAWNDVTEELRPYYEYAPEDQVPTETNTYVGAWTTEGDGATGPDTIYMYRTELNRPTALDSYMNLTMFATERSSGDIDWTEPESFVTATGMPGVKVTGTPLDDNLLLRFTMYIMGGGDSLVFVECDEYLTPNGCDQAESLVDTVWMAP